MCMVRVVANKSINEDMNYISKNIDKLGITITGPLYMVLVKHLGGKWQSIKYGDKYPMSLGYTEDNFSNQSCQFSDKVDAVAALDSFAKSLDRRGITGYSTGIISISNY